MRHPSYTRVPIARLFPAPCSSTHHRGSPSSLTLTITMSTALRSLAKHTRSLSRTARAVTASSTRAFHSPFGVLSNDASSPLTSPPPVHSAASQAYEKQDGHHPNHPVLSPSGQRTYVVSEPDPRATPYDVPYGAFPTSAPYVNFTPTEPPTPGPRASTSPNLAHPTTTRAVPQNPSGVRESAAVRNSEAPGEMGERGGSNGGLGLMDAKTTKPGDLGELPSVNPQPDAPGVAEKFSAMGVDHAWKARK